MRRSVAKDAAVFVLCVVPHDALRPRFWTRRLRSGFGELPRELSS